MLNELLFIEILLILILIIKWILMERNKKRMVIIPFFLK
jgi:hypothetical protein